MTDKNNKIAVIGYGYWGEKLARKFFELDALHLVCDRDEKRLSQTEKNYLSNAIKSKINGISSLRHLNLNAI